MSEISRVVELVARPIGMPRIEDFRLTEVDVPDPGPGEVLVQNQWMALITATRGRMSNLWSWMPPLDLEVPVSGPATGPAVGVVVASQADDVAVGDTVLHGAGWRDFALVRGADVQRVDREAAPPSAYLGLLGLPGRVAYAALLEVAEMRDGDIVFVSTAAGAIGIIVGQIAKLRGNHVIASTGSDAKARYLRDELGFDTVVNYRTGNIGELLKAAAPDGIDVYLDCVGSDHLEAAIDAMRPGGRIAKVGDLASYNLAEPVSGPSNLMQLVIKGLSLRGNGGAPFRPGAEEMTRQLAQWLAAGRIRSIETVVEGLERAPEAFIDLMSGGNIGNLNVKIA